MPGWVSAIVGLLGAAACLAQPANPVYVDDSPAARDTLARIPELVRSENTAEAVRALQQLLDEEPLRVLESRTDPDLYVSVREHVHAALRGDARLLEQYRRVQEPRAAEELARGEHHAVELSRWLTPSGFEAGLRVAQEHFEAARFDAAVAGLLALRAHPDADDHDRARALFGLLEAIAPFADQPDAWDALDHVAASVGAAPPARRVIPRPPAANVRSVGPPDPQPAPSWEALPPRPLATVLLGPSPEASPATPALSDDGEVQDGAWAFPAVAAGLVFVNDGVTIGAWDRLTLAPRWRVRPGPLAAEDHAGLADWWDRDGGFPAGFYRALEDSSTVTVAGPLLVATTGLVFDDLRDGDPRVHALRADTGEILWSVHVGDLDPALAGATVRGPAIIEGDAVVLSAVKSIQSRRLVSLYMLALRARDGSLSWVRPIASAGALPFDRKRLVAPSATIHRGVVYRTDPLGVVAAVDAASGRPLWIRRAPAAGFADDRRAAPWESDRPIVDDASVVTLAPDGQSILRLDAASGSMLGARPAAAFAMPRYLLRAGARLVAVGPSRIAVADLDAFEHDPVDLTPELGGNESFRGRVVASGDRLLAPVRAGALVIDPARPDAETRQIRLDFSGNVLALEDGLLAIDGGRLHAYVPWDVAEAHLTGLLRDDPRNPEPAVTYADLAARTGRLERVVAATDLALGAIAHDPGSSRARQARQRLYRALLDLVAARTAAPDDATPTASGAGLAQLGALVDRLGRVAETDDERVAHLMCLGRYEELAGSPARAVGAYQRILGDAALTGATWHGPGVRARAALEASRHVLGVLRRHGAGAYAAFDEEAARAAAALPASPAPEQVESLARRYPGARVTPGLWLRAGEEHERASRGHAAVVALTAGLAAAEEGIAAGRSPDEVRLGEIAGRLVERLEQEERLAGAARLLGRVREQYPGVVLTRAGEPIDADGLWRDFSARLGQMERLARVGTAIVGEPQSLPGWTILRPLSRDGPPAVEHVMLLSAKESRVALWGTGLGGAPPDGDAPDGPLRPLWDRGFTGPAPDLLRVTPEAVYLLWSEERGRVLERIDALGGATRWRTEPLPLLLPEDAAWRARLVGRGGREREFATPLDGHVSVRAPILAIGEGVLVYAERGGRAAAFDVESGRLLWTALPPVAPIHDADADAGLVVFGGVAPGAEAPGRGEPPRADQPCVAVYDARTGELIRRLDASTLSSTVRWTRLAGDGTLAVGMDEQVASFHVLDGAVRWTIDAAAASASQDAWIFGDRLFLLGPEYNLWLASLSSGQMGERPLDARQRLHTPRRIEALALGERVAFATARGLVVFDSDGRLVGLDPIDSPGDLLVPRVGESHAVTVRVTPARLPDGRAAYPLHVLDAQGGSLRATHPLILGAEPAESALLDGLFLLSAGDVTIAYPMPAR